MKQLVIFIICVFSIVFIFTLGFIFLNKKKDKKLQIMHYSIGVRKLQSELTNALNNYFEKNRFFPPEGKYYFGDIPKELTTPICYLNISFIHNGLENKIEGAVDPFQEGNFKIPFSSKAIENSFIKGGIIDYLTDGSTFFYLLSPGPNKIYNNSPDYLYRISRNDLKSIDNLTDVKRFEGKILLYDPTNGINSSGDIMTLIYKNSEKNITNTFLDILLDFSKKE